MAKGVQDKTDGGAKELERLRARVSKLEAREEKYKQKAETLRESERRFRQLAAASSEGIVISEAGKILDANEQYARIVGYKRSELVGMSVLDLVVPEDRARVEKNITGEYERRYEHKAVRRDGAVITLEVRGKPIPYEGRPVRITAVADVTERRRAEEELRASEERYRRLFEAAQDGILILDAATGEIVDANPFLGEILGHSPSEILGKKLWDIGFLADVLPSRAAFAELKREKYIRYDDLPLQAKDGRVVEVEFVSNVYQVNGTDVIQCNIRDVTARKAAERALHEAETRLRAVVTNAPVILYAVDRAGTITLFEGKAAYEAGYKPGELVGLNFFEDFADQPYLLDCVHRALAGKEYECTVPGRKGRLFDMRFTPIRDERKRVVGATAVGVDITATVEAEKAVRKNEAETAAIFRGTPVIMALVDEELRVRRLNRDGAAFAGRAETDVVGRRSGEVLRCLHALDDTQGCGAGPECATCAVRVALRESLRTGAEVRQRPATFETYRDGACERISFLVSATPLNTAEEKAVLLTLEDVTDLERARAATASLLAASRAVLGRDDFVSAARTIFDQAKAAVGADNGFISLISPEGILLEESYLDVGSGECDLELPAVNYIHGLRAEVARAQKAAYENDFPDSPSRELLPEGHMPMANVLVAPLVAGGETVGLLALGNKPGGFTEEDLATATAYADVAAVALQKFRAQDRLAASEERYALAQRAADIGSWDWDITSGGLVWSDAIEPMFGFGPGEFGGTYEAFLAAVHPDDRELVVAAVDAAVKDKRDYDIEHRVVWPDGTVRWVFEKGKVFYDDAGKPRRMLGVVRDITTRKEARDKLQAALAEAERRRAEMAALLDAAGAVLETPRFEAAAEAIFKSAKEAVGATAGYVALLTEDGTENDVVFLDTGEGSCAVDPDLPMPIRGFREVAIREQKPIYENDFGHTSWIQYLPPGHTPLQNVLFAPLNIRGKTVGLLGLGNKPGGFTANDALVAGAFADFAAVALQNYRNLGRLEASEEQYRRIVETAEEGIWMVDENNNTVFVNQKMASMLGYGERDLLGEPFLTYVDADPPTDRAEELRRRGVIEQRDLKLRRRDGTTLWGFAVMSPIFDESGRYDGALMMITDITERKRAEDALREAELRYRSLFEQSPDGILVVDPATMKPREFNDAAARQLGYTPEEFADLAVYDYEVMETVEETRAHVEKLLRLGRDDFETQHRTKSGEILNVFVTTKLVNINGREGFYTIFRDLTPLKRAEEQLVATAAELARSNRDLEQFAYAASHDLQEPLRMVSSYLQLLEKRYGDRLDGDAVEFLNYAVDGARRMGEMVQDLLDYSRVGSRGAPFEPTDLNAALDQALADMKVAVEEAGARVTRDDLPTVSADASQMRQLFQNLLGNAVKFRGAEPPAVHVGAERRDGEWRIAVRDNGIGLAPQFRERIFGVFQRLHGPGEYPGTGIGLAICERIVTRHGGRIWAESEPGRGATFYFTLPEPGDER